MVQTKRSDETKVENNKSDNGGSGNDGTGYDLRGNIMDEKKENIKEELKAPTIPLSFGQEYGSSIMESLTYRQYLSDSAWVLDNFNPVRRILPLRDTMPDDESKKLVDNFVKGDVPTFLLQSRIIMENCLKVGVEISDIAKNLAIKRAKTIEKY
jgi:hypothetical protein